MMSKIAVPIPIFDSQSFILEVIENSTPHVATVYIVYIELILSYNKSANINYRNSSSPEKLNNFPWLSNIKIITRNIDLEEENKNLCRQHAEAINGMKIAFYYMRKKNKAFQDSRIFKFSTCGTYMLAERPSKHEELYKDNSEAFFFDSDEDLLQKKFYYLHQNSKRMEIARRGNFKSYTSCFDNKCRMRVLLRITPKKFFNISA